MGDFPPEWRKVSDLPEGGQAHAFVVERADGLDRQQYVLKRLKNPKRFEYFIREIEVCQNLNHENILPLLTHGRTPKGTPFLISEYCEGGSLEKNGTRFDRPLHGLRLFQQILSALVCAHGHAPPIYHLDLKPENVFLRRNAAVVGDFGLCVIADDEVEFTQEGQRGSRYYCAPELRNPKLAVAMQDLAVADIYSLGKILYWLFTNEVFDGSEEEYSDNEKARLASLFPAEPQFAFVDEIISESVRRKASSRLKTVRRLEARVNEVIAQIEAEGRVLDLAVPKLCLFCGRGHYQPLADPPALDRRLGGPPPSFVVSGVSAWAGMYDQTAGTLGQAFAGISPSGPVALNLICDYCGNLQSFRWDRKPETQKNWRP